VLNFGKFLANLTGGSDVESITDLEAALGRLSEEKRKAEADLAEIAERRTSLLLADEDRRLDADERAAEKAYRVVEKVDLVLPDIKQRLAAARLAEKRVVVDDFLRRAKATFVEMSTVLENAVAANERADALFREMQAKLGGEAGLICENLAYHVPHVNRATLQIYRDYFERSFAATEVRIANQRKPRVAAPAPMGETALIVWLNPPDGVPRDRRPVRVSLEAAIAAVARGAAAPAFGDARGTGGTSTDIVLRQNWLTADGAIYVAAGHAKHVSVAIAESLIRLKIAERRTPAAPHAPAAAVTTPSQAASEAPPAPPPPPPPPPEPRPATVSSADWPAPDAEGMVQARAIRPLTLIDGSALEEGEEARLPSEVAIYHARRGDLHLGAGQ
jgi:hypothetical protein